MCDSLLTFNVGIYISEMAVPKLDKKIVKKRVKKFKRTQSDWKISVKVIFCVTFSGHGLCFYGAFTSRHCFQRMAVMNINSTLFHQVTSFFFFLIALLAEY